MCTGQLGDLMLANDTQLMAKSKIYVAKLIESVAVIKVAIGFMRAEFMSLHQNHDKPF